MFQKLEKKAIFIDIDGTLMSGGELPSKYNICQLRRVRQQGDMVFLNTGRSYGYIPRQLREADYIDGIVAGGGAHVVLRQQTIYRRVIAEDVLCAVSGLYLRIGKWCLFEGEEENYEVFRDGALQLVEHEDDFRTRYRGALISKITMQGEVGEEERQVLHPHFYLYRQNGYSEGFIRGESKTGGIEKILQAVHIDKKQTIGIGDSLNDVEMLLNTEFGIAMKNACVELKQIADVTTDDCWHDGVGKALEKYLL